MKELKCYIVLNILYIYFILSIPAFIGWITIIVSAFKTSSTSGILSILLQPYAYYYLLTRKEATNIFEIFFFVHQTLTYFYLPILLFAKLAGLIALIGSLNEIFIGLYVILSIIALVGFVGILMDTFKMSFTKGLLFLLIWPYALYHVLREKERTNFLDFFFFIHQIITYIFILAAFSTSVEFKFVNVILFTVIGISLFAYALSWVVVIIDAIRKSFLRGIAAIVIPFYWLYYAFVEFDTSERTENLVKWGLSISLPVLFLFALTKLPSLLSNL